MASPGELVVAIAETMGFSEATVLVHDRALRAAGFRSTKGRGWSAAKVTTRDAANLLTALLGSWQSRDAVDSVLRYAKTRVDEVRSSKDGYRSIHLAELSALPPNHSFVRALEALLISAASGALAELLAKTGATVPRIEISAQTPGTLGAIRLSGMPNGRTASVHYIPSTPPNSTRARREWKVRVRNRLRGGDMQQSRRVTEETILRVAKLLGEKGADHE